MLGQWGSVSRVVIAAASMSAACADNVGVALVKRTPAPTDAGMDVTVDAGGAGGASSDSGSTGGGGSDVGGTAGSAGATGGASPVCEPVPSSALAWWRAEGDGVDSISGFDLTELAGFVPGQVGQAFSFNGVDQFAQLASGELMLPLDSLSTEFWVRTSQEAVSVIFALYDCSTSCVENGKSAWTVRVGAAGRFSINVRDADGGCPGAAEYQGVSSVTAINDGNYHHVVVVRNVPGAELVVYVDGVRDGAAPLDPACAGTLLNGDSEDDPFTIGARRESSTGAPVEYFTGEIDELTMYADALDDAQVAALYAAGMAGKCVP